MFTMAAARVMLPDHRGGLGDWACHLTRPHLRVDPSCAAWIAANRIDAAAAIMGRGRSSSSERGGDKRKKKSKKDDHRRDRVRDQAAGRNATIAWQSYSSISWFTHPLLQDHERHHQGERGLDRDKHGDR